MKLKIAQLLVEAADQIGEDVKLYENYSGRFMYGKTTTGIVLNSIVSLGQLSVAASLSIIDKYGELTLQAENELHTLMQELKNLSTDNMGYDYIIY